MDTSPTERADKIADRSGTVLLTVTYLDRVGPQTVTLRTGWTDAVVIGGAMLERDEIARTLNVRSA